MASKPKKDWIPGIGYFDPFDPLEIYSPLNITKESANMEKEKVTKKQFDALENFCNGRNKETVIKGWLRSSHTWNSDYKPLREMGLEKFVKCAINGYEMEFDIKYQNNMSNIGNYNKATKVKYNFDNMHQLKYEKNPIIIYFGNEYASFTIAEAKEFVSNINKQLTHLSQIRSDI